MLTDDRRTQCSRRMARKQGPGPGEMPWTNRCADEEQSGFAHAIGFLVSHCDASHVKHTRGKRATIGWTGWEDDLLPPLAKPTSWDVSEARAGRVHHEPGSTRTAQAEMPERSVQCHVL